MDDFDYSLKLRNISEVVFILYYYLTKNSTNKQSLTVQLWSMHTIFLVRVDHRSRTLSSNPVAGESASVIPGAMHYFRRETFSYTVINLGQWFNQ